MSNTLTKKRVLLVDDDPESLKALEKTLVLSGYQVGKAPSVDQAMRLLQSTPIDLVITEIQLSDISGLDLLKWIQENHKVPVILMSASKDIRGTLDLAALGAEDFLEKPIVSEDLFHALTFALDGDSSVEHDFCRMSIDEFILGARLKFDMYFKIRNSKFVKVSHQGEDLDKDRALSYKAKNLQYLYVKKEDYLKFIELNLESRINLAASKSHDERRKIEFLKGTTETTIQNIFKNEINHEDCAYAGALVMNSVNLLSDDSAALDLLIYLSKQTDFLYAHSVGVSLYSILIARAMKIQSPPTLFKLSVGGLLHDIGKKKVPVEILSKKKSDISPEEREILQRHPTEGAKLLAELHSIPSEVVLILHQHHENCLGTGYPSQLTQDKIHPSAKIVSLANEFCNLTIKNPNSDGMGPKEAIALLLKGTSTLSSESFDREAKEGLSQLFK
jgi:putative nucleotidyltransferase with HDIG domain